MNSEKKLVIFKLDNEYFAADIIQVERILGYIEPTKTPEAPDYILGVINYQDNIIPIIDLRKRFNLGVNSNLKDKKIIVVKYENRKIGLIVDNVTEVLDIDVNKIEDSPFIVKGKTNKYLSSIIKLDDRIIMLINTEKIISNNEFDNIEF